MEAKGYTLKLTEDMAAKLNAVLTSLGADPKTITFREVYDLLFNKVVQEPELPPQTSVTETDEYLELKNELSAYRATAETTQKAYESLSTQYEEVVKRLNGTNIEALQKNLDTAQAQLAASRHRVDELTEAVEAGRLSENAIVLELDGATATMLSETCERLHDAAGRHTQLADFAGVTPGVLLVSMFRRYVKERSTEWFFPLAVLPAARIAEIEQQTE
jgi:hypothetical protein